jgi:PAS domain S-box-containing protein
MKSKPRPNAQPGKPSKRVQGQETPSESRQLFYTAFHSSPTAIVLSRLSDGRFVEANQSFLELTGYELAEVIGLTSTEAGITSDPQVREERLAALQQGNPLRTFEIDVTRKSGEVRNGLATVAVIVIDGEEFALSTFVDITERKRAERQVVQMKRLYATLSEVNQTIMRVKERDDLFQSVCNIAVNFGEFALAWIGLLDESSGDIIHVASSGLDVTQWAVKRVNIHQGDFKDGLTATAIRTSRVITSENLQTDKRAQTIRNKIQQFSYHSSASVPFQFKGKTIGALALTSREQGLFKAQEEVRLLEEMGQDISFALDNMEMEAERKRVEQQLRESEELFAKAFYQSPIGIVMTDLSDSTVRDINDSMLEMIGSTREQIVGKHAFQLNIEVDPEIRAAIRHELHKHGSFRNQEVRLRIPSGETRDLLDSGAFVLIGGKPHNLGLFQDITERKRAEEKIQDQIQRLNSLREIDAVISSSFNMSLSLDIIVSRAVEELNVDAVGILILDNVSYKLEYQATQGFRTRAFQDFALRVGEGIVSDCIRERKPIHIRNLQEYMDKFVRSHLLSAEKFVGYFCVPLISNGEVKGVLEIFQRSELAPGREWIDFLHTLAGQAAIAIEGGSLFDSLQRSNLELGLAYDRTIEGWSRALDLRDKETEGHTQRVSELTVKLAQAFGFTGSELLHIRRGCLLHDIGKLGVPDEILFKPSPLTAEEWVKMRKHPEFAYTLIAPIQYLRPALDIPYCHHEKWDGTGYPRGLRGEQIPLAARLFAIVDVWDALRNNRPYRAGWPEEKVREYIRAQVGTHFDPKCVELFFQVINEKA